MIGSIAANEMKIHLMIDKFRLTGPVLTPCWWLTRTEPLRLTDQVPATFIEA